jgi:hypothetical protein
VSPAARRLVKMGTLFPVLLVLLITSARTAEAAASLFLQEPFGTFGHMNPTGHAAVYLSQVCAATPVLLRPCGPGETGVVISRYHRVDGYDWVAIPLLPYLYAVDRAEDVPLFANAEAVEALRDTYRRSHLEALAPDAPGGKTPHGEWTQLIGAAYDRRIYSFEIETTPAKDEQLIAELNSARNKGQFNLFIRNCADFSRGIINSYYPHATHRSIFSDVGITTPKQIAKSLISYAKRHPELQFSSLTIEQIPGSPRSRPIRGVIESFVKSKKYVVPLAALHPLVTGGLAVYYLTSARSDPRRNFTNHLEHESRPDAIVADLESNNSTYTANSSLPAGQPVLIPAADFAGLSEFAFQ